LDAIPNTLEASANSLEWVWQGLASAERYVVSVLAEVNSKAINQKELEYLLVEKGVRIVIHQLQSAPKILQEWDIIEPVENGYKFRVELLRRWICKKKPVTIVQKELDYIEPQADNLYKVGLHFYERFQLEDAVNDLQRALTINPNHLQATLLLSRIFFGARKIN
jgi:tetratricopeptide (TPR) repeat protein